MSWYLDSSAILKLVLDEKERPLLVKEIKASAVTSKISRVEVKRAVTRLAPDDLLLAENELAKITMMEISDIVLRIAKGFSLKVTLRTLDAIHVATVLVLGESIEGLISYDKQMIKNAKELGIQVLSPGVK